MSGEQKQTTLPASFNLCVGHTQDGWWVITAPDYPGLYVAHRDLDVAMRDVPLSLGTLIRLNQERRNGVRSLPCSITSLKDRPMPNDTTASKPWFALQRMAHKLMCQGFSHDEAWRRANILLVDEPQREIGDQHGRE